MDDWKLKARVVVKLKREANMFVSILYRVLFLYLTILQFLILNVAIVIGVTSFCVVIFVKKWTRVVVKYTININEYFDLFD